MSANTIVGFCGAKPQLYIVFLRFAARNLSFTQVFKGFGCRTSVLHKILQVLCAEAQIYTGFERFSMPKHNITQVFAGFWYLWRLLGSSPAPAGKQYVAPSQNKISNLIARKKLVTRRPLSSWARWPQSQSWKAMKQFLYVWISGLKKN